MKKILEYNKKTSKEYGWKPEWFGCKNFDEKLIKEIKNFQKEEGVTQDGMLGPGTFRRLVTHRESKISDYQPDHCKNSDHIVCNGEFVSINWPKVVLWDEGLKLEKGWRPHDGKRDVKMFVNHWDVCLNSKTCARVLNQRGLAVQFMIDNDGTIYQGCDANHIAYHAGGRDWNASSIGVEISNAHSLKYQSWYKKNGFGERPVIENATVHGSKQKPFTGFYDVQIQALKALWEACGNYYGIPFETPLDPSGAMLDTVSKDCEHNKFRGFINHFHLTRRKIDCAGLDIKKLLEEMKK